MYLLIDINGSLLINIKHFKKRKISANVGQGCVTERYKNG